MKWDALRSRIYDAVIVSTTSVWYREFLTTVPMDSTVLDVGIGTATSLIENRDLLVTKRIKVHGVDYDQGYIDRANGLVAKRQLGDFVTTECCSIHDFVGGPFDVIYFSGSFMIIPDKAKALRRCCGMLKDPATGTICFTQTFEKRGVVGRLMTVVKPLLKLLLTIDFGQVTYEDDFRAVLEQADVVIQKFQYIRRSTFRNQVLVLARPRLSGTKKLD